MCVAFCLLLPSSLQDDMNASLATVSHLLDWSTVYNSNLSNLSDFKRMIDATDTVHLINQLAGKDTEKCKSHSCQ